MKPQVEETEDDLAAEEGNKIINEVGESARSMVGSRIDIRALDAGV